MGVEGSRRGLEGSRREQNGSALADRPINQPPASLEMSRIQGFWDPGLVSWIHFQDPGLASRIMYQFEISFCLGPVSVVFGHVSINLARVSIKLGMYQSTWDMHPLGRLEANLGEIVYGFLQSQAAFSISFLYRISGQSLTNFV